jgi:hypothetical protein
VHCFPRFIPLEKNFALTLPIEKDKELTLSSYDDYFLFQLFLLIKFPLLFFLEKRKEKREQKKRKKGCISFLLFKLFFSFLKKRKVWLP